MPIYDYQCASCGESFEVERPMGATARVRCRTCGSTRTEKVYSAAGVHFKGSGFYITDSSKKSSASVPATNGKPVEDKPAAEKPAEKPAKSKPAADKTPAES